MALINRYSFLRWSKPLSPGYTPEIPLAYKTSKEQYFPFLVPGETTSFYIAANLHQNLDFKLRLTSVDGIVVNSDIATVSKVMVDSTNFEFYCTMVNPNIPDGFYQFGIFCGNAIVLESNIVYVISRGYENISSQLKYRNDRLLYGVNYDKLPGDFYQQFRLQITEIDRQAQSNVDQYRSSYKRNLRNLYNVTDEYVVFETYYFNQLAHEALIAAMDHSEIYINGLKFTLKTGHKITTHQQNSITKGQFEMWNDKFTQDAKFDNTELVTLEFVFWNDEKSQDFRKNNCGAGYRGTLCTYTVKAHTYKYVVYQHDIDNDPAALNKAQGLADQLALDDILLNGQLYANEKGTCEVAHSSILFQSDFSSWNTASPPTPVDIFMVDPTSGTTNTHGRTAYSSATKENDAMRVVIHDDGMSTRSYGDSNTMSMILNVSFHAGTKYRVSLDILEFIPDMMSSDMNGTMTDAADGQISFRTSLSDYAEIEGVGPFSFEFTPSVNITFQMVFRHGSFLVDNLLVEQID